jgi:hypothetical protein
MSTESRRFADTEIDGMTVIKEVGEDGRWIGSEDNAVSLDEIT